MFYKMNCSLEDVTLPDLDDVEFLRNNGVPVEVTQRKNYDEYYINNDEVRCEISMSQLKELSTRFTVEFRCGEFRLNNT
jgi:hypothetical protein